MNTITLSPTTYHWLQDKARESARTPDQVAEELLTEHLAPRHAYIEVVQKTTGPQAVIKGTRVPVSIIVGYIRIGETPETLVKNILPHLMLAQVYDALSYYHDHQPEIEQELEDNSEEKVRAYLRETLGEEGYLRVTGQTYEPR